MTRACPESPHLLDPCDTWRGEGGEGGEEGRGGDPGGGGGESI